MTRARMLLPSPMLTLQVGQSVLPSPLIRRRQEEQVTWPFGQEGTESDLGTKRHTGHTIASLRAFKSFLWLSNSSSFPMFSRALIMRRGSHQNTKEMLYSVLGLRLWVTTVTALLRLYGPDLAFCWSATFRTFRKTHNTMEIFIQNSCATFV